MDPDVIDVVPAFSDTEADSLKGSYKGVEDCDTIFNTSCDVYTIKDGTRKLLAKFRKNYLPADIVKIGYDNFHKLAQQSTNRGAAAGPIDPNDDYWSKRELVNATKFSASIMVNGVPSKMSTGNTVNSSVLGYMDNKTIHTKIPCRLTSHTNKHLKQYQGGLPFIEAIDDAYKKLIPTNYNLQKAQADKKPNYRISNTAFSTVTINRNFRTACHKDAGDCIDGFGNLTVIERGDYSGGYTLFPQYRIGFDVRSSDILLCDVHEWHCNSEIYETDEQLISNNELPQIYKNKPETGIRLACKKFSRISFVCYLRDKLIHCPEN